jgi:hypothetical protein
VATRPDAKKSDGEDRPDVVLLWDESSYFAKAIAKDRPNEANFRSDAPQPESEFV